MASSHRFEIHQGDKQATVDIAGVHRALASDEVSSHAIRADGVVFSLAQWHATLEGYIAALESQNDELRAQVASLAAGGTVRRFFRDPNNGLVESFVDIHGPSLEERRSRADAERRARRQGRAEAQQLRDRLAQLSK